MHRISIAGITFELRGLVPPGFEMFEAFATQRPADYVLRLERSALGYTMERPVRLTRDGSRITYEGPNGFGALDLASREGSVARTQENLRALQMTLRFFLGAILPERGGLLLHGAAVERGGRGYLFVGPSGAGKSTIAALCGASGGYVLNDEVVALCKEPGDDARARLFGTPLGSARKPVGGPGDAPYTLLAKLAHADTPTFAPIKRGAAAELLLAQTVAAPEVADAGSLFDSALALSGCAPAGLLGFRKEPDFWSVLP